MDPHKAIDLASITLLPATDSRFCSAVDDMALIGEGLIAAMDAALLAIALPTGGGHADGVPTVWNQRLVSSPALARALIETPMLAPALTALRKVADALFARLDAWHWAGAAAPGLCVVTDGTMVGLSLTSPPADAGCGWLLDLARPNGGAIMLREPLADGIWSLIAAEAGTAH